MNRSEITVEEIKCWLQFCDYPTRMNGKNVTDQELSDATFDYINRLEKKARPLQLKNRKTWAGNCVSCKGPEMKVVCFHNKCTKCV